MMPQDHLRLYHKLVGWTLLVLAAPLFWWVSNPMRHVVIAQDVFLFWHTAMEIFAVLVSLLIFITGYRAILSARKGVVVLLGISFLGVAVLDFLHLMSYVGMPDAITPNSPHKSMFFWLAARLLAAVVLLLYALLPAISNVTPFYKRLGDRKSVV